MLAWAQAGLVDVVQYDIFDHGFTNWLALGQQLDAWNIRAAPHHYGGHYGNYVAGHLAGAIKGFSFVEWDEATVPGLDTSQYQVIGDASCFQMCRALALRSTTNASSTSWRREGSRGRSKRNGSWSAPISLPNVP